MPRDVDALSLWEFTSFVEGWRKANCSDDEPKAPSEERYLELIAQSGTY